MPKNKAIVARAVGVIGATTILATGVTWAALSSTATLSGNTINSATAGLLVQTNGEFGQTATGFAFNDVVPGAGYGDAKLFNLRNSGSADLDVSVYATSGATSAPIDKSKVYFKFVNTTDENQVKEYTLQELQDMYNKVPGEFGDDNLAVNETDEFSVAVKMDNDAVNGSSASVGSFNLVFTGNAVNGETTPTPSTTVSPSTSVTPTATPSATASPVLSTESKPF